MSLALVDFFCGAGGSSQGATAVPGVSARLAANHWQRAIDTHAANFPHTEHYRGDLHDADVAKFPAADLFWASPECPAWSQARGRQRDFDRQPDLFGDVLPDEATDRSRALMWDVPRYLEAMALRGRPVLAGVVENVTDVRAWSHWHAWRTAIAHLGYRTRLIALNSMHARPRHTPAAPQSRDRLYLAYWALSLGRDPDWDRWLRPATWCPSCGADVAAVQWWKRPGNDMGRYRQQYLYRCPRVPCRGQVIEPAALPAAAAIDWTLRGTRIGDRTVPLRPKTMARIAAGLHRYARPITLEAAGHTWERRPGVRTWPVDSPLTTQTASATKALACPPLMVPAGGTWREAAAPVTEPMPTRTARENDALVFPPFITIHRGADGDVRTLDTAGPLTAVTASGNHFGLAIPPASPTASAAGTAIVMRNNTAAGNPAHMCSPVSEPLRTLTTTGHQSLITWEHLASLLVPYNRTGVARPVTEPAATVTAIDRFALASAAFTIEDVLFRMLEPHEIAAAMAFAPAYRVLGSKREKVRQYGNAVTPPVAEVLISALAEAITGQALP